MTTVEIVFAIGVVAALTIMAASCWALHRMARRQFGAIVQAQADEVAEQAETIDSHEATIRAKTAEIDALRCRLADPPELHPTSSRAEVNFGIGSVFDTEQARDHYERYLAGQDDPRD